MRRHSHVKRNAVCAYVFVHYVHLFVNIIMQVLFYLCFYFFVDIYNPYECMTILCIRTKYAGTLRICSFPTFLPFWTDWQVLSFNFFPRRKQIVDSRQKVSLTRQHYVSTSVCIYTVRAHNISILQYVQIIWLLGITIEWVHLPLIYKDGQCCSVRIVWKIKISCFNI